ncbi:MAG TPA: hypothetical protein VIJ94_04565 [Caulobacteraceae bacterium]
MAARASRPWARATAIAVAIHAVLFALAILSVKIVGPPPDPRATEVKLIQLRPPPLRRERSRPSRATALSAPTSATPASSAPILAAPAAASAAPVQASTPDGAADRIRAMLRGSAGCESAAFLKLSEAEQQKCARWRMARIDPDLQIRAPIDPVKRSWYDATMEARKNGRAMPFGPPGRGVPKFPGLPPGHALFHLGPLSVGLPPGSFNDDEPPPP